MKSEKVKANHRWVGTKCECGCETNHEYLQKKGRRRKYSFDGFKTYTDKAPPCTRKVALMTKEEKRKEYKRVNKEKIRIQSRERYQKKKQAMILQVMQPV